MKKTKEESGTTAPGTLTVKAQPKPGELKALFTQYETVNAKVTAASAAYDKAVADRSKIVEQFAVFGKNFTSPSGAKLKVSSRTNEGAGTQTFYFRGEGVFESLKIE